MMMIQWTGCVHEVTVVTAQDSTPLSFSFHAFVVFMGFVLCFSQDKEASRV